MAIVVVVILNLLIALMSDLYSIVKEHEVAETTYGLAKLVVEYESILLFLWPKKHVDRIEHICFPRWLYVLKRVEYKDHQSNNEINELRKELKELKDMVTKLSKN